MDEDAARRHLADEQERLLRLRTGIQNDHLGDEPEEDSAAELSHVDQHPADSASDAAMNVLRRLDDFRGQSRFTTWAYKFAVLETSVKMRRRPWHGRELPLEPERWPQVAGAGASPQADAERRETLEAVRRAIDDELTPHQREVLVAVALNDVPIDVMAERLGSTRGALYKTIHDARDKLRRRLQADGHA